MEELKEFLKEIKVEIDKNVLYPKYQKEKLYWVGQMNLLNEIFDIINEI